MAEHRNPTHAYGLVRLPGMRWVGTGGGNAYLVWLGLSMLALIPVKAGALLALEGQWTSAAVIGAIVLALVAPYPLALATRPRVRLPGDTRRWRRVEQIVEELRRVLPRRLPAGRAALRDVERARWEIALLLRDGATVGLARAQAEHARYGLDPQSPERLALEDRCTALGARIEELDHQVDQRIASLDRLALSLRSINDGIPRSDRRRRRKRARLVGEQADAALCAAARWRDATDPGAGLADSADAYASAYRELSQSRPGEAGWRA